MTAPDTKVIRANATSWPLPSGIADDILALCDALDAERAEVGRIGRDLNMAKYGQPDFAWGIHLEAMAELKAENDRLREALKPFAEEAAYWLSHNYSREDRLVERFKGYTPVMTCGDLFDARAVLGSMETNHD